MRIYNPKKYFKRHGVAARGRAQNFVPCQSLIFTLEIIIVCRVRSQKYSTLPVSANQRLRVHATGKWCITIFPQVASLSLKIAWIDCFPSHRADWRSFHWADSVYIATTGLHFGYDVCIDYANQASQF